MEIKGFTISTNLAAALVRWCSGDVTRPLLRQLLFDDGAITCTDGHRLVRAPFVTPFGTFAVTADLMIAAIAAQDAIARAEWRVDIHHDVYATNEGETALADGARGKRTLQIVVDTKRVHVNAGDGVALSAPRGDHKSYPSPDRIIEQMKAIKSGDPAGYVFNPEYMAGVGSVLRALGGEGYGVKVTKWSADHRYPIELVSKSGVRFFIMPMRPDSHEEK